MRHLTDTEVERLLAGEVRSRLPLARQVMIYLDPFALFKDASRGPLGTRDRALTYNRMMRWMLVAYLRRWIAIAASLGLLISQMALIIPMAVLAVGCCIAITVVGVTAAAYLLLGREAW